MIQHHLDRWDPCPHEASILGEGRDAKQTNKQTRQTNKQTNKTLSNCARFSGGSKKRRRIMRTEANACFLCTRHSSKHLLITIHLVFTTLSFWWIFPFGWWGNWQTEVFHEFVPKWQLHPLSCCPKTFMPFLYCRSRNTQWIRKYDLLHLNSYIESDHFSPLPLIHSGLSHHRLSTFLLQSTPHWPHVDSCSFESILARVVMVMFKSLSQVISRLLPKFRGRPRCSA